MNAEFRWLYITTTTILLHKIFNFKIKNFFFYIVAAQIGGWCETLKVTFFNFLKKKVLSDSLKIHPLLYNIHLTLLALLCNIVNHLVSCNHLLHKIVGFVFIFHFMVWDMYITSKIPFHLNCAS